MKKMRGLVGRVTKPLLAGREPVVAGVVSPRLTVPPHIRRPSYHDGTPPPNMESVSIRPKRGIELAGMRDACVKAAEALKFAGSLIVEGATTDSVDRATHAFVVERLGCYPSPLGYAGFPKSICTSINEVLCHGIPDSRPLRSGDVVNVDVSVFTSAGYHGDCSEMFVVGECDVRGRRLVDVTRRALEAAIAVCGVTFCSLDFHF